MHRVCVAKKLPPGAGISVTWYTHLEQGRGGPPSVEVLEHLSTSLELSPDGREILFLLAQNRPPPLTPTTLPVVPIGLQDVLDAFSATPAIVKTATWDIVAWNRAANCALADYEAMDPSERNLLRQLFFNPTAQQTAPDWEDTARFAIDVFRIGVARMGGSSEADALLKELEDTSADFRKLYAQTDGRSHGTGTKRIHHAKAGLVSFEYTAFSVEGADGLTMIVFRPASAEDAQKIEAALSQSPARPCLQELNSRSVRHPGARLPSF